MRIDEVIAPPEQIDQLADVLLDKCSLYFSKTANIMWRGIGSLNVSINKFKCPRNRAPKDTQALVHEIANAWFVENTGIAYRADAVFTTGGVAQARGYGNMYAIFPIGDFRFCWSPTIMDFTFDLAENFPDLQDDDPDAEYKIYNAMNHAMYQTTNLKGAISSGHEIMVHCDEYYAVSADLVDRLMTIIWQKLGH